MKVGDKVRIKEDIKGISLYGIPEIQINKLRGLYLTVSYIDAEPGITVIELKEDNPLSLGYNIDLFEYADNEEPFDIEESPC